MKVDMKNRKTHKKKIKPLIKDILKTEVKLTNSKENVELLEYVYDNLIKEMKCFSKLFKIIYKRRENTGSYYENLRVKNATEFDIDIVLHFPFENSEWKIEPRNLLFCKCKQIKHEWETFLIKNNLQNENIKIFNDEYYLLPDKVKSWFQKVIDNSYKKIKCNNRIKQINRRRNGPAITLEIICEKKIIEVDLVPVLEFNFNHWPKDVNHTLLQDIPYKKRNWFIVPKPPEENIDKSVERLTLWRMHFPGLEEYLLHRENSCIKSVIKLMKLLRDKENWRNLSSYYLKTVMMLEIINHQDLNFNQNQYVDIFIMMLEKLQEYVSKKHLPHILCPEYNHLHKINDKQLENISHRLKKIKNNFLKDSQSIHKHLS